ncbi:selenide, water dikinase SelD [Vagococcus lutrae]|uniref:selenide, water dikinase SelD n=1 Tax=Vagococcus lutrae TaxID=81947 RepID=UPI002096B901|nr:selenide, water dikinase SelD [Vagococcus lutrae]MCO7151632.1 selenide, water dikinase SelD [Vagococcus lutrae]MDT2819786.1 selenide, water dikinase SelD [Vagococcus lutrae]MDT2844559.1 selenide, water dikinase SelD [Vagococcus lutrae]
MSSDEVNGKELYICGGCNAKIGAGELSSILKDLPQPKSDKLLVGFDSSDDAAVYALSDEQALIQTLDFFPTMVSDPYLFGQIAATNALSDVYAMGGSVLTAMNIVCFPEEGDLDSLALILKGGAEKVQEAGGLLVGGHSIHDALPKYGLSVTGTVHPDKMITNQGARLGDYLILTKPIGVSVITSGYSIHETDEKTFQEAVASMTLLNKYAVGHMHEHAVSACTDVTGFGLLGHLLEMLSDGQQAVLWQSEIPYLPGAYDLANEFMITAGGQRNRNHLEDKVLFQMDDFAWEELLYDPQTSGGLLMSLPVEEVETFLEKIKVHYPYARIIGQIVDKKTGPSIVVESGKE